MQSRGSLGTLNCKTIKYEHIQQYMVGRVEKYEQISKLPHILKKQEWTKKKIKKVHLISLSIS